MKRSGFSEESKRKSREKAMAKARSSPRKPLKRSTMKRTAPKARGRHATTGQPLTIIEQALVDKHRRFQQAARVQGVCAQCGAKGPFDPHHVVEKKWLKKNNLPLDDEENALRLCPNCHANHTSGGTNTSRVELKNLKPQNYRYAFRMMGAYAGDYLRSHYRGEDHRLDHWERQYE